jgi:hypothetical protein
MININDEEDVKKLREAYAKDDLIVRYIKQELKSRFDINQIDTAKDNATVGEDFKVYARIKEAIKDILQIFN